MQRPLAPTENTSSGTRHPETLRIGRKVLHLVVDPLVEKITKGDPVFGWAGDDQLALYLDFQGRVWHTVRWESGRYSFVAQTSAEFMRIGDLVPSLILFLVEHDGRRGFDVVAAQDKVNDAVLAERQRESDEFCDEVGEQLHHALVKEGVY